VLRLRCRELPLLGLVRAARSRDDRRADKTVRYLNLETCRSTCGWPTRRSPAKGYNLRKRSCQTELACFDPHPARRLDRMQLPPHSLVLAGMTSRSGLRPTAGGCRRAHWLFWVLVACPGIGLLQAGEQPWRDRFTTGPACAGTLRPADVPAASFFADRLASRVPQVALGLSAASDRQFCYDDLASRAVSSRLPHASTRHPWRQESYACVEGLLVRSCSIRPTRRVPAQAAEPAS